MVSYTKKVMKRYDFEDDENNESDESKDELESYKDEDDDEEDEDFFDDDDFYGKEDMIKELEISFQESQNKTNIIKQAIKICSKSFFWRFYSYQTKLKMIEDCFKRLSDLGI